MATIVGDVTNRSGATTHKIYLVLLRTSKVSTKGKNTATYQNLRGRVPSTPLPPVPRWGYEFACTSEC